MMEKSFPLECFRSVFAFCTSKLPFPPPLDFFLRPLPRIRSLLRLQFNGSKGFFS